jgi:hypothetical protein
VYPSCVFLLPLLYKKANQMSMDFGVFVGEIVKGKETLFWVSF